MLAPGTRLGSYEVLAPLGAGGMGEVYRARDTRLGRDVAIKVLPASFASDPERLRRFEQEARAVAALNHPNILAVYDIGTEAGAPFLVTELLEGETLRERLKVGPLPVRKAVEIAVQAACGVAAAHEKGITHRDLKPANIFLTADGRVKILDFGLAKLTGPEAPAPSQTQAATLTAGGATEPGVVLGTAGYMSPEQVRGKPADARSDIFGLGAILYEMLSGRRAFEKDSSADTMAAILKEDPPELAGEGAKIPPGVERIVRHCLEKNPGERFQSARDLAFDLESLSGASTTTAAAALAGAKPPSRKSLLPIAAVAVALVLVAAGAYYAGRSSLPSSGEIGYRPPSFTHINFKPEVVFNARFAPDGETVVYAAAAEGNVPELFIHRADYPAPQPLGLPDTELLSISSRGELAVLTGARFVEHAIFFGTLARMDLGGGAPREILENVQAADWTPDGSGLAIVREVNGESRLEYPVGKVLFQTAGYVSDLRFSPRGDQIAFFDHPFRYDDRGSVDLVDLAGHRRVLTAGYEGLEGLAWAKDGSTIYFGAVGLGSADYLLRAVTLGGKVSTLLATGQALYLEDADAQGNLLVNNAADTYHVAALAPGAAAERGLNWLDQSNAPCLSADGEELLFTDDDAIVGNNYALLLRKTDGSPVVRLGDGDAMGLSPDGQWALSIVPGPPAQLVLYPTGAGEKRALDRGEIENYDSARFFPDGKRILACGNAAGRPTRCYVQEIAGSPPRPVTPEGTAHGLPSPDGSEILVQGAAGAFAIYPVAGGPARPVPGLGPDDVVIRWTSDGRSVYCFGNSEVPAQVVRVNLSTGRRTPVRTIAPADRAGVYKIREISLAKGAKSYAYSYERSVSTLVVVKGLR